MYAAHILVIETFRVLCAVGVHLHGRDIARSTLNLHEVMRYLPVARPIKMCMYTYHVVVGEEHSVPGQSAHVRIVRRGGKSAVDGGKRVRVPFFSKLLNLRYVDIDASSSSAFSGQPGTSSEKELCVLTGHRAPGS